jgi:protein-disulfide isomerase
METTPPKRNFGSQLLVGLLVVAAFAIGMLWQQNQTLKKDGGTVAGTGTTQGAVASPLEVDKLKQYAADLKLDKNKFNECLDTAKYKDRISKDTEYGSSLDVSGTPAFFVNGRFIGGAFPFEWFKEIIDKEIAGTGSEDIKKYSQGLQDIYNQDPQNPPFNPKKKEVTISNEDPVKGSANAKVTIVEFSDFECPYCARAYPTVKQILQTYGGDVRFIYKQFPLSSIHPKAQKAAEASLCAQEQGKFYEYHDKLFEVQQG